MRDEQGEMVVAIVKIFGDTTYTLIERSRFNGVFMPGYRAVKTINSYLTHINLDFIDHCVGN